MSPFLVIINAAGMFFACALSILAVALSRRKYLDHKLSRAIMQMQADNADITEKVEHITKLFRKQSARIAQRERREKENGTEKTTEPNGEDKLAGEDWKRKWRRENLDKLTLNKGR